MLVVAVADPVVVVLLVDVDVEVDVEDVVVVGALVVVVSVVVGGDSAKAAAATPMAKSSAAPRTAITFSSGMGRSMDAVCARPRKQGPTPDCFARGSAHPAPRSRLSAFG